MKRRRRAYTGRARQRTRNKRRCPHCGRGGRRTPTGCDGVILVVFLIVGGVCSRRGCFWGPCISKWGLLMAQGLGNITIKLLKHQRFDRSTVHLGIKWGKVGNKRALVIPFILGGEMIKKGEVKANKKVNIAAPAGPRADDTGAPVDNKNG